jgi:general secretion pathway protein H
LPRQRGFTLWELLVVVAIVAMTFTLIQLSPGLVESDRNLKRLGKDLGKMFRLLNQEAVFENRDYAISVRDKGFVLLEFQDGAWVEVGDSFFRGVKMTDSQSSVLLIEDRVIDISKTDPKPHILILSSGEMTPFEWRIRDAATQKRILLEGTLLGGVLMTGPEPLS